MGKYLIIDLDNCISDDQHRFHLISEAVTGRKRYQEYEKLCMLDEPKNLHLLYGFKPADVIVFTGRHEAYREQSLTWFRHHIGYDPKMMLMRGQKDFRKSPVLKRDMLFHLRDMKYIDDFDDISTAYDDYHDVIEMYQSYGIKAYRVAINERGER